MRDIVVSQRKDIGNIDVAFTVGQFLHLALSRMDFMHDFVYMLQKNMSGLCQNDAAALLLKENDIQFLL